VVSVKFNGVGDKRWQLQIWRVEEPGYKIDLVVISFRFQPIVNLPRIVRHHQSTRQRWSTQIMMSISTSRALPTSARPVTYRYTNS
jgi:hypothetical protein